MARSYLTELDLTPDESLAILADADRMKAQRREGAHRTDLAGKHVAVYFEKPSVRTRISFTVGVHELGGQVVELTAGNTKLGHGEELEDFARVVSGYVHLFVARVFSQQSLRDMAATATIPVINALSDERHPCQALADVMAIREKVGRIEGVKFVYVGDGNNVAASTGLLAAALGADVYVCSPDGYRLPDGIMAEAQGLKGRLTQLTDPREVVKGADVLYTDTWISMGQEAEAEGRRKIFKDYRITEAMVAEAGPQAWVMHCLPAVREEEIEKSVMYGAQSAIWDQAENRLHAQKALMRFLMSGA